jgi:hypothetical protein
MALIDVIIGSNTSFNRVESDIHYFFLHFYSCGKKKCLRFFIMSTSIFKKNQFTWVRTNLLVLIQVEWILALPIWKTFELTNYLKFHMNCMFKIENEKSYHKEIDTGLETAAAAGFDHHTVGEIDHIDQIAAVDIDLSSRDLADFRILLGE